MQTYHACDHVINATITICPCTDNCKVCQEEEEKREYYDRRWQKNEDGYNVCGMCMKMLRCWAICEAWFCTRCKKEKKRYSIQKQKDLGSISVTCCSHTASYKEKERRLSTSYWKKSCSTCIAQWWFTNRDYENVAMQAQRDVYYAQLQKCQDTIIHLRQVM